MGNQNNNVFIQSGRLDRWVKNPFAHRGHLNAILVVSLGVIIKIGSKY